MPIYSYRVQKKLFITKDAWTSSVIQHTVIEILTSLPTLSLSFHAFISTFWTAHISGPRMLACQCHFKAIRLSYGSLKLDHGCTGKTTIVQEPQSSKVLLDGRSWVSQFHKTIV